MGLLVVGLNHSILLASSPSTSPKLAAAATGEHSLVLLSLLINLAPLNQPPRLRLLLEEEDSEQGVLARRHRAFSVAKLHLSTAHDCAAWRPDICTAAIPAAAPSPHALHTNLPALPAHAIELLHISTPPPNTPNKTTTNSKKLQNSYTPPKNTQHSRQKQNTNTKKTKPIPNSTEFLKPTKRKTQPTK